MKQKQEKLSSLATSKHTYDTKTGVLSQVH